MSYVSPFKQVFRRSEWITERPLAPPLYLLPPLAYRRVLAYIGLMSDKTKSPMRIVADNRRGRFDYEILNTYEAGIQLTGTEVKSLRTGRATIAESYAGPSGEEFYLFNANIPEYLQANRFNHQPKRPRRLLLHKREINRLIGAVQRDGLSVIPLKLYFNGDGRAKLELALARGKKLHDKRETSKQRDWNRDKARLMKERG